MSKHDKIKDMKEQYDNINIPNELENSIEKGVNKGKKELKNRKRRMKSIVACCTTAACAAVFILSVNINPAMAESMKDVPILGSIVRMVTIKHIDIQNEKLEAKADIPVIEGLNDKTYQAGLNDEIKKTIEDTIAKAKLESETIEEGQMPVIVQSDYILKSVDPVLSFGIVVTETKASATETFRYYNIDLKNNKDLQLKDLFADGADYVSVISQYVQEEIDRRVKSGEGNFFSKEDSIDSTVVFDKISEQQKFYINSDGKLVVTFDEYEIAPGSEGAPEFIIPTECIQSILNDLGYVK